MKTDIFERFKYSHPVTFWFYTRIPFLVFIAVEAALIYLIFWVGQKYFSAGITGI